MEVKEEEMDSILTSIKKMLGIEEIYEHFDVDLIIHINSVLSVLSELGLGNTAFKIEDKSTTWNDFLQDDTNLLECVKSYIFLKVKLLFDPPLSSAVIDAINRQISELEWRINVAVDPNK